jgi:hypothetical protein
MSHRGGVAAMRRGPQLAEILIQAGLVSEESIRAARLAAEEKGGSLPFQLVQGGLDESALVQTVGRALRMPTVSLRGKKIDPEVLRLVPPEFADRYGCLPLFVKEESGSRVLYLAIEDPTDRAVADDVSFRVGMRVLVVVAGPLELRRTLRAAGARAFPLRPAEPEPLAEQPISTRDTEPILAERPDPADGTDPYAGFGRDQTVAEMAKEGDDDEKPREVATREILRAVTRLLLEKKIFTRAELMSAVSAVRGGESRD